MLASVRATLASLLLFSSGARAADEKSFVLNADIPYQGLVATQQLLVQQAFGDSWNKPAQVHYAPPPSAFNRVVLELQVNSTGSNYDRLGQLFVDDMEIWRTSTPEPDDGGTNWVVRKDVSHYGTLFNSARMISLLIENRVVDQITGVFYVSLTASFYNDPQSQGMSDESWILDLDDLPSSVVGLAKDTSNPTASWSAPGDDINVAVGPLDRSVNRAVLHIFASGNGDDEFWWDSSHQSSGAGPGRFVDVYVGGYAAGFAAPYPVIYSGGVNPYLWKPMVDIHAFDVPAYFIDISPFLPLLWEGSTTIALNVTSAIDGQEIPSNWIVNYNLLTWSTPGQQNSGQFHSPQVLDQDPGSAAGNSVLINRKVTTSASLNLGGTEQTVQWDQSVGYNNTLETPGGTSNNVWQQTYGSASVSGPYEYSQQFSFPFQCQMSGEFYRVQQSYDVFTKNNSYIQWIDTSVSQDDQGQYTGSSSRQYLGTPHGSHFAETENLQITVKW